MSRRFDKNNSVKFQVVHRSQQDSRYYDDDASSTVLVPIIDKKKKSTKIRATAAEDLKEIESQLKKDEGKAALYGIAYDDTEYDYLQHLKPIGSGEGIFISKKEVIDPKVKNAKLAALLDDSVLPGEERAYNYQSQQDVPDEIAGFKPDLNPDLREALIALEDENYLDQEQDIDEIDVFEELLGGEGHRKKEISLKEYDQFDDEFYDDDYQDDDWDYDNFEEHEGQFEGIEESNEGNGFNWENDYAKYKNTRGRIADEFDSDSDYDESENDDLENENADFVGDLPNIGEKGLKSANTKSSKKKAKRKKGTTTDTSSYSMSSSALCRTEQMTIIDDKFDVLREQYDNMDEEEEEYEPFDIATERDDFMDLVDDFLDNYQLEKRGKRVVKKNEEMERYRLAAMSVTKDNSRVKNRNLANKSLTLSEEMNKLKL